MKAIYALNDIYEGNNDLFILLHCALQICQAFAAERYMNLGLTDDALQVFKSLKAKCKYYNGNFVLLFHNTEFLTEAQKQFYIEVLDC